MQTPLQVAKTANVTVGTIRNWSRDYAEFLSPSATGSHGTRLFSDEDIEVIRTIAALRKSGVPPPEVSTRLRNHDVPPVVDGATTSQQSSPQQATTEAHNDVQAIQAAPFPLQSAYNALQGHVQASDKRIDALERALINLEQRQGEVANKFVSGAVVGGAVVLVVVAIVLALTRYT